MQFGVLGPLLVDDGGATVAVPAGRQRVLLAALLVRAGSVVAADELAELVWDSRPPDRAAATLRMHVMRLRRTLGPRAGARLLTRYPGYLIEAAEDEVDLLRFASLCGRGGTAVRASAWADGSAILAEAVRLWRGVPLADVPSQLLRQEETPRLEQLYLQAQEWRIDARLHLGCGSELVPELQSLSAKHPLRERFHAQLMLALYRCGRQAEALAAYQNARQLLISELGTEPGTELRDLQRRILAADPALEARQPQLGPGAEAGRVTAGNAPPVPHELPPPVRHFMGRERELAALAELAADGGQELADTVVISAIGGTAGVGKTALAVRWAHQAAGQFPDGQLYVNLRGYDPGDPMPAADALAWFLRALGVAGPDIPADTEERAARYRSLLAGRRVLVLLDNARGAAQVRPLLPGSPGCAVLVTSRDALAGLVARDGARRLELDLLPLADATGLLRALIGARASDDPQSTAELAGQCCRLPLALRVAAELAAARPATPLRDLVGQLRDEQSRLRLLAAGGDQRTGVRAVLSWSYRQLDAEAARAFRLAGLHPGPDLDAGAAAALTGTDVGQAGNLLDQLSRAYLIQRARYDRYLMHDLLRAYARDLAAGCDFEEERRAALTGLFRYYLRAASIAVNTLYPAERHRWPTVPPSATPPPPETGEPATARDWLDTHRAVLAATAAYAADHGWPGHATLLAETMFRYLDEGGHYPEAVAIHGHARRAASQLSDRTAEAEALTSLSAIDMRQGRYRRAISRLEQALSLCGTPDSRAAEARALSILGVVDMRQGRYEHAAEHLQRSLALCRAIGHRTGETHVLDALGEIEIRCGRLELAAGHFRQALTLARQTGDRGGEAHVLSGLGEIDLRQGRYQPASQDLRQWQAVFREVGDRPGEAENLFRLGLADLRQARHEQAARHFGQALAIVRRLGDQGGEALALNGLGDVLLATGEPDQARKSHAAALDLAGQIGAAEEEARAHQGIARACEAAGDSGQARGHWRQALARYTHLGLAEADQVRARLAASEAGAAEVTARPG